MLNSLTLMLCCQLVGETLVAALRLPVPAAVLGMVMLFVILLWKGRISPDLAKVSDALLSNLALLFVPAGVGIMTNFALLSRDWLPLSAAILCSTLAAIAVTAGTMVAMNRMRPRTLPNGIDGGHD